MQIRCQKVAGTKMSEGLMFSWVEKKNYMINYTRLKVIIKNFAFET